MTDPSHPKEPPQAKTDKEVVSHISSHVPTNPAIDAPLELGKPKPVSELTPEEQMALFEKDLKEKDWGHQPC